MEDTKESVVNRLIAISKNPYYRKPRQRRQIAHKLRMIDRRAEQNKRIPGFVVMRKRPNYGANFT